MPEELALEQVGCQRRTMYWHKWLPLAGAVLMNRLSDQLLTRASLPLE